jgi:hypothetical protein
MTVYESAPTHTSKPCWYRAHKITHTPSQKISRERKTEEKSTSFHVDSGRVFCFALDFDSTFPRLAHNYIESRVILRKIFICFWLAGLVVCLHPAGKQVTSKRTSFVWKFRHEVAPRNFQLILLLLKKNYIHNTYTFFDSQVLKFSGFSKFGWSNEWN